MVLNVGRSVQKLRGMGSEFQRERNYTLEQYIVKSSVELMVTSQELYAPSCIALKLKERKMMKRKKIQIVILYSM